MNESFNQRLTHAMLMAIILHLWHDYFWGFGGLPILLFCFLFAYFLPKLTAHS